MPSTSIIITVFALIEVDCQIIWDKVSDRMMSPHYVALLTQKYEVNDG
jgi:hypothetical protein